MKMDKNELTQKAKLIFEKLKCEKLMATSDGCFFTMENQSFARSHSASYGHELFVIETKDVETVSEKPKSKKRTKK